MKGFKLIGKGLFSKVYSDDNLDYVIINKNDYIKEAMAFEWFPDSKYFPKIEEIEIEGEYYWKSKKYDKTRKINGVLNDKDFIFYQELRKIFKTKPIIQNKYDSLNVLYNLFKESSLTEDQKELMVIEKSILDEQVIYTASLKKASEDLMAQLQKLELEYEAAAANIAASGW